VGENNKKAVLQQRNRAMPKLFFNVRHSPKTKQTNLTKQTRLCLKADVNANLYEVCNKPSAVSLVQPKFRGVPFVVPAFRKHYANQPWNYFRCITIYLINFNVTDTFCQFCGISGINDLLESRSEVI